METSRRSAESKAATWFCDVVSECPGTSGQDNLHLAWIDASNSLSMPIISSQLMFRLTPTLLRCVLHLEAIALLLVEVTEVRNGRLMLGSEIRG